MPKSNSVTFLALVTTSINVAIASTDDVEDKFEIALITATVRKAKRIEFEWAALTHLRSIPLRVVAVSELIQLVNTRRSFQCPIGVRCGHIESARSSSFWSGRGGIRIADEDRLAGETACRAKTNVVPASSVWFATPITASPLVAKHFGPRPSKRRPSCGPTASPNADKRD